MSEEEEGGARFRVTDKRKLKRDDDSPAEKGPATPPEEPKVLGDNAGVHVGSVPAADEAPIDFGSFVLSLAHGALVALGMVEHPETGARYRDLESARQTIEILQMLHKKTRNNLDPEEEKLLTSLLYELRLAYVEAAAQKLEPNA